MSERDDLEKGGPAAASVRRRLVLAVDGVPWQAVDEARGAGYFSAFNSPARVISPFPTMTNIGMCALLGAPKTLGYENLYFDRQSGRLRGGAAKYVSRRKRDPAVRGYSHLLDYQEPMQFEFLVYMAPGRIFEADLGRLVKAFEKSDAPEFHAFLKSTDGLIHVGGPDKLRLALERLDSELSRLRERHGPELEIVVYSDHGNALVPFKRLSMKTHLASHGFVPEPRIRSRRSVIIPGFGLCSYAPIYAEPECRRAIAEALASLEGVDFSVFQPLERDVGRANAALCTEVIGPRGRARIHRENRDGDGAGYRYEPIEGDPLSLSEIGENLRARGSFDARGFATDRAWFEATREHAYPDALCNIWSSVREHVESTADVLVSLEDGYCYGAAIFDRIIRLAATHGSAFHSTSYAFLMSTHKEVPAFLRAADARPWLCARQISW